MVDFTGRAGWRGGAGGLGPLGGGKSASFTPSAKKMGKKDLGEPEFGLHAHSTEWWRPAASPRAPALGPARLAGWASPIGGVGQPDLAGGPARLGGWASPIWGGGWPRGRRASHPPDRAQTTTYGAPVPNNQLHLAQSLAPSADAMLSRRLLHGSLRTTLRCTGIDTCAGSRRCFSSRFTKTKKRVEVLEKEPDRGQPSIFDRPQQQVRLASA